VTRVNIAGLDRAEIIAALYVALYDRDNGAGAAARVIDNLRKKAA